MGRETYLNYTAEPRSNLYIDPVSVGSGSVILGNIYSKDLKTSTVRFVISIAKAGGPRLLIDIVGAISKILRMKFA